jgi:uncharacterized protein (DUF1330 family)
MPAYLVAQVDEVRDPAGMQEYVVGAAALMAKFGGRYLVAAFGPEALEGPPPPLAIAVAEFPSIEQLRAFWSAPAYAPLRELRHRSAVVRLLMSDAPTAPAG